MTKVKICGLRRMQDIEAVNRALPDFIGFVFAKSRRQVDAEQASKLKHYLDPRILSSGVFVNQAPDFILDLHRESVIDMAQLHGDEDEKFIKKLRQSGCPVIRAVPVKDRLPDLPENADYLLFDTASPQRGGTGSAFDWRILSGYEGPPYFLAGGLDAGNVCEAIALLRPYCVDVSSSVETDGIKDAEKIGHFTRLVKEMR
ncbi:MAG: phosphoribosylanthranilate isomerase [Christensenellales bacterium]|jgi:phosphoribosylanthranilate isomerase